MTERGAATPIVAGLVAVVLVLAIGLGDLGRYLVARAQAEAAAEAAALAAAPVTFRPFGAAGTARDEAARFARHNGVALARCDCAEDRSWATRVVEVEVAATVGLVLLGRRRVVAIARAEFAPTRLPGP